MDLKIKDVADLLNVSETTIRRWLAEGKIPAYRINHQYRFSRGEIQNWVMSQKLAHQPAIETVSTPEDPLPGNRGSKQFSLYRAIHKGGVIFNVPGDSKEAVIRNVTSQIAPRLNVEAEVISDLLMEREKMQPTALNRGIGIPHTRDFLLNTPHDIVTVAFPEKLIDYGALDNKPVHTLFFLFACQDKQHLHLLAKIAHLCSQPETINLLQTKPGKEKLLEYVKNWEAAIPK